MQINKEKESIERDVEIIKKELNDINTRLMFQMQEKKAHQKQDLGLKDSIVEATETQNTAPLLSSFVEPLNQENQAEDGNPSQVVKKSGCC